MTLGAQGLEVVEVAGMIMGTALALSNVATILLAVLLGLDAVMY